MSHSLPSASLRSPVAECNAPDDTAPVQLAGVFEAYWRFEGGYPQRFESNSN